MDIRQAFPRLLTTKIEESDLPLKAKIASISENCKRLFFEDNDKVLPLNMARVRQIAEATKTYNTDEWVGQEIEVFWDKTIKFGKEIKGGIRVRGTNQSGKVAVKE